MPTPSRGPRMGGSPAHERLMLANLATALFEHGRITTTHTKAKRLRPYAEHLVTFGKRGDLHARRQVLKRLRDKSVVHTLFAEIGPRYANRPGGYTRITKLGPRKGDNAPMAIIELVEAATATQGVVGEAERARGTRFTPRSAPTGATAEAAAELASESPTAAAVDVAAREAMGGEAGTAGSGAVAEPAGSEAMAAPEPAGSETLPVEPAGSETLPVEVPPVEVAPVDVAAIEGGEEPGSTGRTDAEVSVDEAAGSQPGPDSEEPTASQ